ncbi:MAG: chitosanase [Candidatus Riflebacteria bacterium]|nr:chitosanase [Candidatus Riflebacteria bacterium]
MLKNLFLVLLSLVLISFSPAVLFGDDTVSTPQPADNTSTGASPDTSTGTSADTATNIQSSSGSTDSSANTQAATSSDASTDTQASGSSGSSPKGETTTSESSTGSESDQQSVSADTNTQSDDGSNVPVNDSGQSQTSASTDTGAQIMSAPMSDGFVSNGATQSSTLASTQIGAITDAPLAGKTSTDAIVDSASTQSSTSADTSLVFSSSASTGTNSPPSPSSSTASSTSIDPNAPKNALAPNEYATANKLKAIFENSTDTMQYDYAQVLTDHRGWTLGRDGYTTRDGDALLVAKEYINDPNGDPKLQARFKNLVDTMEKRSEAGSGNVKGLEDLPKVWSEASRTDPQFNKAQDKISNQEIYNPAMKLADNLGAKLPLTKAALYEAGMMHGFSDADTEAKERYDSVDSIADRATKKCGGNPSTGVDEKVWLKAFLQERKADLINPANKKTQKEWSEAVGRADTMIDIYNQGNFDLTKKMKVKPFDKTFSIP